MCNGPHRDGSVHVSCVCVLWDVQFFGSSHIYVCWVLLKPRRKVFFKSWSCLIQTQIQWHLRWCWITDVWDPEVDPTRQWFNVTENVTMECYRISIHLTLCFFYDADGGRNLHLPRLRLRLQRVGPYVCDGSRWLCVGNVFSHGTLGNSIKFHNCA